MSELVTRVDFSGPFFQRDPGKTLRGNIQSMMDDLAGEMQQDVRGQIEGRAGAMPFYTGWSTNHAIGRTVSLGGKHWLATAVVSENTAGMSSADAVRTLAAASSIERRFHPYRRTASSVRSSRALLADLARGIE